MPDNRQYVKQDWEVEFHARGTTWRHYHYGTRQDAEHYAASLCYEPSTYYVVRSAPPIEERTVRV